MIHFLQLTTVSGGHANKDDAALTAKRESWRFYS